MASLHSHGSSSGYCSYPWHCTIVLFSFEIFPHYFPVETWGDAKGDAACQGAAISDPSDGTPTDINKTYCNRTVRANSPGLLVMVRKPWPAKYKTVNFNKKATVQNLPVMVRGPWPGWLPRCHVEVVDSRNARRFSLASEWFPCTVGKRRTRF